MFAHRFFVGSGYLSTNNPFVISSSYPMMSRTTDYITQVKAGLSEFTPAIISVHKNYLFWSIFTGLFSICMLKYFEMPQNNI